MRMLGSPESELSVEVAGKLNDLLTESDDESEFSNEGLVEEGKLEEIMQELYKEITTPSHNAPQPMVTLPSPSSSSPSPPHHFSSPLFFSASDVKSASCGVSLSDSSSTVMAGIAYVGNAVKIPETGNTAPENELWGMEMGFDDNNDSNNFVGENAMEGCDEGEFGNDQWLTRVVGLGPLEIEDWT